jgi:hypothetical protein
VKPLFEGDNLGYAPPFPGVSMTSVVRPATRWCDFLNLNVSGTTSLYLNLSEFSEAFESWPPAKARSACPLSPRSL